EAEAEFQEELRAYPHNIGTYASLAMLYRASNRQQAVEQVIGDLVEAAPTPEGYSMAARLWVIVGERGRAEALRSDARRRFRGDPSLALLGRSRSLKGPALAGPAACRMGCNQGQSDRRPEQIPHFPHHRERDTCSRIDG